MKPIKKTLLFLILINLFSIPFPLNSTEKDIIFHPDNAENPGYSSPIVISFQNYQMVGFWWNKNGATIENLTINTNGQTPGITIKNFDQAITIRNITIINTNTNEYGGGAIELLNSKNITISNCSFINIRSVFGIKIEGGNNIIINNCEVTKFDYGIYLNNSQNITVSNNNISLNRLYNLYLGDSDENNILSNNITHGTENNGIYLFNSDYNNLSSNTVSNNKYGGIYLRSSNNNSITDNKIAGNTRGVYLHESNYNRITDNQLFNNDKPWEDYGGINNVFKNNSNDNTIPGYMPLWIFLFTMLGICVSIINLKKSRNRYRYI